MRGHHIRGKPQPNAHRPAQEPSDCALEPLGCMNAPRPPPPNFSKTRQSYRDAGRCRQGEHRPSPKDADKAFRRIEPTGLNQQQHFDKGSRSVASHRHSDKYISRGNGRSTPPAFRASKASSECARLDSLPGSAHLTMSRTVFGAGLGDKCAQRADMSNRRRGDWLPWIWHGSSQSICLGLGQAIGNLSSALEAGEA